jgi:hypothetical protein
MNAKCSASRSRRTSAAAGGRWQSVSEAVGCQRVLVPDRGDADARVNYGQWVRASCLCSSLETGGGLEAGGDDAASVPGSQVRTKANRNHPKRA